MPTSVSPEIVDSIADTNTEVIALAPAVAVANLYQATSQALSNAAHNATQAQRNAEILDNATTATGVAMIQALAKKVVV